MSAGTRAAARIGGRQGGSAGARASLGGGLAWAVGVALAIVGPACGGGAGSEEGERSVPVAPHEARTRDGVIAVTLPGDLLVHEHERGIFATSLDARSRLYLTYQDDESLIRAVGALKEALHGRGWEVAGERHYETAAEIHVTRGHGTRRLDRRVWLIERGGRVVHCEAITEAADAERVALALRHQCQRVSVAAREAAPE